MSQKRSLTNRQLFLEFYDSKLEEGKEVTLEGWIRANRDNGNVGFIAFNDGSYFKNTQIVYDGNNKDYEQYAHLKYGAAIQVTGTIKLTPEAKQPFEIHATNITLLGDCSEDYPLQKKRHSYEFLRDIAYLRPRANTFNAVFRIRNTLAYAIHRYFQERGFMYVHTPLITANDAEGAGQVFHVIADPKHPTDFFNANACLTVSGQLHVESFALAFRDVYTFGPTFRAENSNTSRHAAEFWMMEPEMCFCDLEELMDNEEEMIKYVIKYVMQECPDELNFLNKFVDTGLIERLKSIVENEFVRLDYTEAIEILKKVKNRFVFPVEWGIDLQSEHERYLTEEVYKKPVFLKNYPKDIKAFYMRQNDDGKTVAAVDMLVPGIGELCGGSQREERLDKLQTRIKELGLKEEDYAWYLDTRRYGTNIHSGYGLGFERLVMYLTGISNIRDVELFPRTVGSIQE